MPGEEIHISPPWEKTPWNVEIDRYSNGRVSQVKVIASQPRTVVCLYVGGGQPPRQESSIQPAIVANCGIPYAGLAAETLVAHGYLIAASPDLYEALEDMMWPIDAVCQKPSIARCLCAKCKKERAYAALAKARGVTHAH